MYFRMKETTKTGWFFEWLEPWHWFIIYRNCMTYLLVEVRVLFWVVCMHNLALRVKCFDLRWLEHEMLKRGRLICDRHSVLLMVELTRHLTTLLGSLVRTSVHSKWLQCIGKNSFIFITICYESGLLYGVLYVTLRLNLSKIPVSWHLIITIWSE